MGNYFGYCGAVHNKIHQSQAIIIFCTRIMGRFIFGMTSVGENEEFFVRVIQKIFYLLRWHFFFEKKT